MKETTCALEISHKFIKIVFGYVQDNQVIVTFVKKIPINHAVESGAIKDRALIIKELSKNNPVMDESLHFSHLLDDAVLVLPPYGLEIYETTQYTSVISPEKVVGELDVKNIYNIIRNKKLPIDNELIDIIPDSFMLDNGNRYALPPIGKESSAITVHAKVHTLPKRINEEHTSCLVDSNIKVNRRVVSPFAISELLTTYPDVPATYFLVDMGASSTTISLVDNHQIFATRSFSWGGDNITNSIVTSFNISESEAEKIKILYGLDKKEMHFDYAVAKIQTPLGEESCGVKALNQIIEKELASFINMFNLGKEQLVNAYNIDDPDNMPVIFIGGGSKLRGLKGYFDINLKNKNFKFLKVKTIGARDPSLISLLGAILVNKKYPVKRNENSSQVKVTRDE